MAAPTIIQNTKTYFTTEFTRKASEALNEKKSAVSKAMTAIIPLGLAGIISRSNSGKEGSQDIFDRAKNSSINLPEFHDLQVLKTEAELSKNKVDIFGDDQTKIEEAIAKFSHLQTDSASSLLTWSLPAMMGLLGKHAERKSLTPSGLSGYLSSQNDYVSFTVSPELIHLEKLSSFKAFHPISAYQQKRIEADKLNRI